jgi:hypothetical protein
MSRYFLDKLDQLTDPSYVPTDQDLLYCYTPTCGLMESTVHHDNIAFRNDDGLHIMQFSLHFSTWQQS